MEWAIKEYKKQEALILERTDDYYQAAKTRYVLYIFEPGGSALSLFEEGTLDVLPLSYADQAEMSKPDNAHHKELVIAPAMCTFMVALNPNLPPTDDPLVRKALSLATDRSQWIDKLNSGQAVQASGILPPAMPGYQGNRALPAFDPTAAREALAQSTYSGKPLNIVISAAGYAGRERPDIALLVDQWQKTLGAKVTVDLVDPEKYTEMVRMKPGNAVLSGWCADYPDPENFLDVLFHTGSNFNYTNVSDPELDAQLEKARVALDPAERLTLYAQAEERILSQVYAVPINNSTQGVLINPRVKGYILTAIGTRMLDGVSLEK